MAATAQVPSYFVDTRHTESRSEPKYAYLFPYSVEFHYIILTTGPD